MEPKRLERVCLCVLCLHDGVALAGDTVLPMQPAAHFGTSLTRFVAQWGAPQSTRTASNRADKVPQGNHNKQISLNT